MAFIASFQEAAETKLLDNIVAVVDRDMLSALNYFYASDHLPDFAVKTIGTISEFNYPILIVGPERMSSEETDEGFYLSQDYRIGVGLAVKDTSVSAATRKAMKYVRSLKAVLRAATTADLFPPTAQILNHVLDIDHRYFR